MPFWRHCALKIPLLGFFLHKGSQMVQNLNGGDLVVASLQIYSFLWFFLAIFVLYLVIFVDTFVFFYCDECLKRYTIRRFCMLIFHFCYFFQQKWQLLYLKWKFPRNYYQDQLNTYMKNGISPYTIDNYEDWITNLEENFKSHIFHYNK